MANKPPNCDAAPVKCADCREHFKCSVLKTCLEMLNAEDEYQSCDARRVDAKVIHSRTKALLDSLGYGFPGGSLTCIMRRGGTVKASDVLIRVTELVRDYYSKITKHGPINDIRN